MAAYGGNIRQPDPGRWIFTGSIIFGAVTAALAFLAAMHFFKDPQKEQNAALQFQATATAVARIQEQEERQQRQDEEYQIRANEQQLEIDRLFAQVWSNVLYVLAIAAGSSFMILALANVTFVQSASESL